MEAELLEGDPRRLAHGLGRDPATVRGLGDCVAEVRVLEDAANDRVQVDVADEGAALEDAERVAAIGGAIRLLSVDRRRGRLERVVGLVPHGLPGAQELAVREPEIAQGARVFGLELCQASCHTSPRRIGTAAPPVSIPSTSTSGPPIMKSVCTDDAFASMPSGRHIGNACPYAMWQVAFSS